MVITKKDRVPVNVPIQQVEAAVNLAATNAARFAMQMVTEQCLLMLHSSFGFGRERCMKALEDLQQRLSQWQESTEREFDAETFRLRYKEKQTAGVDLFFTWDQHDRALEPLIDPRIWEPYTVRYKDLGGRGRWNGG